MTSASTRSTGQRVQAELSLVSLKNCLVNLPTTLESLLVNANIPAQNVIVEISYRTAQSSSTAGDSSRIPQPNSIFVGWTGMPSRRKPAPIVTRDGIIGSRGNPSAREQDVPLVEIDATFARTLGLSDGQKITAILHLDPPLAHTVNIEPQTSADWEIIELHATFLELNFLSQVRALPNPQYIAPNGGSPKAHPLTLHLSPTSTANILVTSLTPAPSSSVPYSKIAPDAEVIVAPKARPRSSRSAGRENRSVTSRRSAGGRSGASTVRQKKDGESRPALFFRCLDRSACAQWFDDGEIDTTQELSIWLDRDVINSKNLRGIAWVSVTLIKPATSEPPLDPQQQQQETEATNGPAKVASRIIAKLKAWDDPPDSRHVALSSALAACLGDIGIVGGVVKVEPAPPPISKDTVQKMKIYPFIATSSWRSEGLRFGGESKADREQAATRILNMYGRQAAGDGLLDGPVTDGLVLPVSESHDHHSGWEGGILRFEPSSQSPDSSKENLNWIVGRDKKLPTEVEASIPRPASLSTDTAIGEPLPRQQPMLVGVDSVVNQLQLHLSHLSSVLLTGALGSGKTSVAQYLAHRLRSEYLFHTTYFSCRKLVTDETRISTIKETLTRLFMDAAWGARLGGQSLVILDDLDKLCPVETELQVGGENGRSRQISEGVCSIVRQYCSKSTGVVLLATSQAKESLNNVIIGGHVVREIVSLKAPDKEGRRKVMEMVVKSNSDGDSTARVPNNLDSRPSTSNGDKRDDDVAAWMDGASSSSRPQSASGADGFVLERDVDFLDLAGQTDGFMPGDLVLLVSRARSEALIRSVTETSPSTSFSSVQLSKADFERALKGFTPASLRNVTLQTSTTTFDSIGGLRETRKILLETLQYPTTYAPIFAQCPLRLRSGLLLYGYPGCGKTLLASAVAGECGLNFISVKGPEILNKYIGASEKSVRDLFERAEAARPCVLFFDEFDSIAPKRGHDSTGVTDRVVNQLLTQMDGAEGLSGVYVLAATSRPDLIDPALLRPGRLDKSLICDLPNFEDRADILRAVSKKLKLSDDAEQGLDEIARRTNGFSGADLQALVYNAHLDAIHDVLGDHDPTRAAEKRPNASKSNGKMTSSSKDFVQFRYGEQEERAESDLRSKSGNNRSKLLAERANIAAKLEEIKQMKKRQKLARRGQLLNSDKTASSEVNGEDKDEQEVTVEWRHITKSLATTKASLSPDERHRLERIYREFVVGRNGEMPNGQGPTEVGGRSSLM